MAQLMLLFRVGAERYALETTSVVEVIHRVELSKIHDVEKDGVLSALAGRFNYHGQIIPVLDLNQFLGGGASRPALGTRIVLVRLVPAQDPVKQEQRLLGLLVEQVTITLESSQFDRVATGSDAAQPPYIGETLLYQQEMIQSIRPDHLLGDRTYALLTDAQPLLSAPRSEITTGTAVG